MALEILWDTTPQTFLQIIHKIVLGSDKFCKEYKSRVIEKHPHIPFSQGEQGGPLLENVIWA